MRKESIITATVLLLCTASILIGTYIVAVRKGERQPGILPGKQAVAVVHIYGPISISRSESSWSRFLPGADRIANQIRKLSKMPNVKAVVLRMNSPGGSIGAVQEIYQEVKRLKEKGKIVVVSMGDVGASGAYYIACAGDKIVANPGTITGSIGVVMTLGNMEELFRKVGIKLEVIKKGRYKDIGSLSREMTSEERTLLQGLIDDAYEQFLEVVAEARKLDRAELDKIAQGQVFTGRQAKEMGLVDEVGNFQDAIRLAGELAGIQGEPKVIEIPGQFPRLFDILLSRFDLDRFISIWKENTVKLEYILQ